MAPAGGIATQAGPRVCPLVPEGPLFLTETQARQLTHPEAAVTVRTSGQFWRLHWLDPTAWTAWRGRTQERLACNLPVLPPARLVEDRGGAWVVVEAPLQTAAPWSEMPASEPLAEVERLLTFLRHLAAALDVLHRRGSTWFNFHPAGLELVDQPPRLRFTNLDLALAPAATGGPPPHPAFATPECSHRAKPTPRTDVYRLALTAYYWLARLLPNGLVGGPAVFDFQMPPVRTFAPWVPVGLPTALAAGLALNPGDRPATPLEFCKLLEVALESARQRSDFSGPLTWQLGGHTRTGRTKEARRLANEDNILVRPLPRSRALAVVADGVSLCDVGSGALASQIACSVLDEALVAAPPDDFGTALTHACRQASGRLLAWALENGHESALAQGKDLMGTTLTAAWFAGSRVTVGNLGDSRVYLVRDGQAEQLTVDGDVKSVLLAAGVPPEDVRGLGDLAFALRDCVGGCTRDATGRPAVHEQLCRPTLSTWPLLPGDILVLCSDGLVEEHTFLSATELADLVTRHRHRDPEALAVLLADAADAKQRLPSPAEPRGSGDNISCIVVKVAAG